MTRLHALTKLGAVGRVSASKGTTYITFKDGSQLSTNHVFNHLEFNDVLYIDAHGTLFLLA